MRDQNEAGGRKLIDQYLCCHNVEKVGWVYLLRGGAGGVKIGKADSVKGVRRQITYAQTYCETGILGVRLIHGGQVMEQELHRRFRDERIWFEKTAEITSKGPFRSEWFRGPLVRAYFGSLSLSQECEHCRNEQLTLPGISQGRRNDA